MTLVVMVVVIVFMAAAFLVASLFGPFPSFLAQVFGKISLPSSQTNPINTKEPITSASTKRQPSTIQSTAPSSNTRLVEANMKASIGINAAPFCNALRPVAAAAYEHELLAAPKNVASPIVRRLVFPKASLICSLETKT